MHTMCFRPRWPSYCSATSTLPIPISVGWTNVTGFGKIGTLDPLNLNAILVSRDVANQQRAYREVALRLAAVGAGIQSWQKQADVPVKVAGGVAHVEISEPCEEIGTRAQRADARDLGACVK